MLAARLKENGIDVKDAFPRTGGRKRIQKHAVLLGNNDLPQQPNTPRVISQALLGSLKNIILHRNIPPKNEISIGDKVNLAMR